MREHGFQALLAGGCVRDMLLGRKPNDFDVATDARPPQIISLFKRTLKIGAKFGVVVIQMDKYQVEVATFRSESDYTDGRHPANVEFSSEKQDALRRDFTVNGMFYDPIEHKVIDYVSGQGDLKRSLIRTIGKPSERFAEDYLRMLRAVRFSAQLDFTIEPLTFSAIYTHAGKITKISGERISMELEAILTDANRKQGAVLLLETDLAKAVFPALSNADITLGAEVLATLTGTVDYPLALAGFLVDSQTREAMQNCKLLRLSRSRTRHLKFLLDNRGMLLNHKMPLSQLKLTAAKPYFEDLYQLQKAIQKARNQSMYTLKQLRRRVNELDESQLSPEPLLNGHQIIELGASKGPRLGRLAREMYIAQLEGEIKTAEQARKWVRKWLQRHKKIDA